MHSVTLFVVILSRLGVSIFNIGPLLRIFGISLKDEDNVGLMGGSGNYWEICSERTSDCL